MPQRGRGETDDRSKQEKTEFQMMLSAMADLYLTSRVLILLDGSYVGRFWTMMEAWCSMQTVTSLGVKPASESEMRCTIACLHNADYEFDAPKLKKQLAKKTPAEMKKYLSAPDISVTNAKDKDLMLPVVERINEDIKLRMNEVLSV